MAPSLLRGTAQGVRGVGAAVADQFLIGRRRYPARPLMASAISANRWKAVACGTSERCGGSCDGMKQDLVQRERGTRRTPLRRDGRNERDRRCRRTHRAAGSFAVQRWRRWNHHFAHGGDLSPGGFEQLVDSCAGHAGNPVEGKLQLLDVLFEPLEPRADRRARRSCWRRRSAAWRRPADRTAAALR